MTENHSCILHSCYNSPNVENLKQDVSDIFNKHGSKNEDIVPYKQWLKKENAISLVTLELPLEELLEEIVSTIENLQLHHFISITESSFLHNLKENLLQNQIIILQDAAQGFNCNNSQATLHPFIIYYKVSENKLNPINYCIISDCMQNDANAINAFLTSVLADIKTVLSNLTLRYYFSDRAASQYKN